MKIDAKERAAILKRLREAHNDTVERTRALLKEQNEVRRKICQATRDVPKQVPEIAEITGIPANEVLWHVIAMKKYGDVAEIGSCGEYYLYQAVKERRE